jgi:hypothetical protein
MASEWQPVVNHDPSWPWAFTRGFDRNKEYEFQRLYTNDEPSRYRLADQHELFNVANLFFREVANPPSAKP